VVEFFINVNVAQLSVKEREMKKVGVYFLSLGMFIVSASLALGDESVKIGFVDIKRVLDISEAGKGARNQMTLEMEKIKKEIVGRERELEKLKEDLEKRGAVMSETARLDKERDYQLKLRDLQRFRQDVEQEVKLKDRDLTQGILRSIGPIIRKIAEEGKFTLILEKNDPAVVYGSNTLDLTEEVIKIFNQQKSK
jgi:outer membrane protein